jgi:DNA-binding PadR family transcriptional regulator
MGKRTAAPDPAAFLPLQEAEFHMLIALAEGDKHGYAIMQDVAAMTGNKVRLSPGTLYGSIQRMLENGLIEEVRPPAGPGSERRRTYRMTRLGRDVAGAEAARLSKLVAQARATGLIPRRA